MSFSRDQARNPASREYRQYRESAWDNNKNNHGAVEAPRRDRLSTYQYRSTVEQQHSGRAFSRTEESRCNAPPREIEYVPQEYNHPTRRTDSRKAGVVNNPSTEYSNGSRPHFDFYPSPWESHVACTDERLERIPAREDMSHSHSRTAHGGEYRLYPAAPGAYKIAAPARLMTDPELPHMLESEGSSMADASTYRDSSVTESTTYNEDTSLAAEGKASWPTPVDRKFSPLEKNAHRQVQQQLSRQQRQPTMLEVAPGEYRRLRGAAETWRAIQCDFYMPIQCSCCEVTIFCIQSADFILCPTCKVISPTGNFGQEDDDDNNNDGGVGLGFTFEDLGNWQEEIEPNRKKY